MTTFTSLQDLKEAVKQAKVVSLRFCLGSHHVPEEIRQFVKQQTAEKKRPNKGGPTGVKIHENEVGNASKLVYKTKKDYDLRNFFWEEKKGITTVTFLFSPEVSFEKKDPIEAEKQEILKYLSELTGRVDYTMDGWENPFFLEGKEVPDEHTLSYIFQNGVQRRPTVFLS